MILQWNEESNFHGVMTSHFNFNEGEILTYWTPHFRYFRLFNFPEFYLVQANLYQKREDLPPPRKLRGSTFFNLSPVIYVESLTTALFFSLSLSVFLSLPRPTSWTHKNTFYSVANSDSLNYTFNRASRTITSNLRKHKMKVTEDRFCYIE